MDEMTDRERYLDQLQITQRLLREARWELLLKDIELEELRKRLVEKQVREVVELAG